MEELANEICDEFYKCFTDYHDGLLEHVQIEAKDGVTGVTWPNGTTYKGSVVRNQLQGQGSLTFPNNSKYEGVFMDGLYHGEGVFVSPEHQLLYKGCFKLGLPHDKGLLNLGGSDVFVGDFSHGKKASGVRFYENGTFIGQFDDDQYRKCGKYFFTKTRTLYTGFFHKGLPHGVGQVEWGNQFGSELLVTFVPESYRGCWKNGLKHGLGILRWNHMSLMALWDENRKQGPGLLIARNGDVFVSSQMYKDDKYLGTRKLPLNHENIGLIREMLSTTHFDPNHFKLTIKKLDKSSIQIPDVSPFHLPDYQIELNTTPIYNFINDTLTSSGLHSSPALEFKSINQVIVDQYFKLRDIYLIYANFEVSSNSTTGVVMNRLGLWQLLRDLGFDSLEIDISNLITAAESEFQIIISNSNDFREPVYFCNFLKYLLYLTMLINETKRNQKVAVDAKPPFFGYFATMFVIFLNNVVFKVRPFSKGAIIKEITDHNVNLRQFLALCSKLTEKLTIRTAFQWLCVLIGCESISVINGLCNAQFKTPEFCKGVSYHELYQCVVHTFPKMIQNQTDSKPFITKSTFNITPLEFYELFEAIVTYALKKSKHLEGDNQIAM